MPGVNLQEFFTNRTLLWVSPGEGGGAVMEGRNVYPGVSGEHVGRSRCLRGTRVPWTDVTSMEQEETMSDVEETEDAASFPNRRSIRLKGYDYSQAGPYFGRSARQSGDVVWQSRKWAYMFV